MKRSVRLTAAMWSAALLLILIAFASLIGALVSGSATIAAASAMAPADATASVIPSGSPTPVAVPTISAGTSGLIAPAAPALAGATIATTLTCVTTIIGLLIAVVTLTNLLRGGYGPFLRALIFGGKRKGKNGEPDGLDEGHWDASRTLNYRPGPGAYDDPFASYNSFDEPDSARRGAASRSGSRNGSRGDRRDRRERGDRAAGVSAPHRRSGARHRVPASSRRNGWE
ncbi:MAG TPA: hypothetical protein VE338_10015 [Ktedonobacterales bacterium]|jgi:hypothetical protein|nr:hypothetical protein [Ktedonobacterales bacterium]